MTVGSVSDPTAPGTRCRPCHSSMPSPRAGMTASSVAGAAMKSGRAKERVFSTRDEFGQWEPRNQRPELWSLYNGRHLPGGARSDLSALQLDRAGRLGLHRGREDQRADDLLRPRAPGGLARRHVDRDHRRDARAYEVVEVRSVRYRTVGDMSCTAAVLSAANTVHDVINEVGLSQLTERGATRADDRLSEAAMEDRKREGYF